MKKNLKLMMVTAVVVTIAVGFTGCKTTHVAGSGIKGQSASVKKVNRQIVDYQGASTGSEIPMWVKMLNDGQYGQKALSKVMPDLEGKKIFVVTGQGDNLDFVKSWVTLVDIETQVSGSLERVTGKVVTSKMEGKNEAEGQENNKSQIERTLNDYRIALQDVRIAGLERVAEYWTLIDVIEKKKTLKSYYTYYSVWAMNQDIFNRQLEKSLEGINEATTEAAELKKLIKEKLENELSVSSNNADTLDEADSYILYEK